MRAIQASESGSRNRTVPLRLARSGVAFLGSSMAAAVQAGKTDRYTYYQVVVICTVFAAMTNQRIPECLRRHRPLILVREWVPSLPDQEAHAPRRPRARPELRAQCGRPAQPSAASRRCEGRPLRARRAGCTAVRGRGIEDPHPAASGGNGLADRAGQSSSRRGRVSARAGRGARRLRQDDVAVPVGHARRAAVCLGLDRRARQ